MNHVDWISSELKMYKNKMFDWHGINDFMFDQLVYENSWSKVNISDM